MTDTLLKTISEDEVGNGRQSPVDKDTLASATKIVDDVKENGESALRRYAEQFGDIEKGGRLIVTEDEINDAKRKISSEDIALLERTASRIHDFAKAQLDCFKNLEIPIPGGRAGHTIAPVERAGCYAPGGRFPLPSSVLMTVVTARVAGVEDIWLASPQPKPITLAAAGIAGAKNLLAVGGAQAIAALAYGALNIPPCDIIVGPGNRFVTAAKQIVYGKASIDMLAGPSELLVLADENADPSLVAADLLAQAEHDPDAIPALVTTSERLIAKVNTHLRQELLSLPTADVARMALKNGFAVHVENLATATRICNRFAPEHLALHVDFPEDVARQCKHYGGLFIGAEAAEVFGDYGAGPNHTLPTGGTARYAGGLSVLNFLRVRTWLKMDDVVQSKSLLRDVTRLAELEGLRAHALSAKKRRYVLKTDTFSDTGPEKK